MMYVHFFFPGKSDQDQGFEDQGLTGWSHGNMPDARIKTIMDDIDCAPFRSICLQTMDNLPLKQSLDAWRNLIHGKQRS